MKLSNAILLTSALATTLGTSAHAAAPFQWSTDEVLLGTTTNSSRTADDVVANPFDIDQIFVAQTGNTSNQAILRFTLSRTAGQITGATLDYDSISTLDHNGQGLKSLDFYNADTLYYSLEEGGNTDTDGLIGRATSLAADPLVHTSVADLTGVRADLGSAYDPEGIAIDRLNNYLYVMTDDGTNQSVAQYTVNGDLSLSSNWSVAIGSGGTNGNDGIVLSDGRVAAVSGSSSASIFAISQSGTTVTDLLGGATSGAGRDQVQDLLEFDGYLYVAWESGIIDAFDMANLSTTPDASIDLDTLIAGGVSIGGIDVTSDGHLLVATRAAGGSTGEIYAFNAVPEPGSLALLGLGGLALIRRRRRA